MLVYQQYQRRVSVRIYSPDPDRSGPALRSQLKLVACFYLSGASEEKLPRPPHPPSCAFQLFTIGTTLLITIVPSAAPASFCKCTCFSNSTIIQLDSPPLSSSADFDSAFLGRRDDKKYRSLNCNDCNRKFCLDYNLPVCKGAKEEDVFTTCFRTWDLFRFHPVLFAGLCVHLVSLCSERQSMLASWF